MSQSLDRALTVLASLGDGPASLEQAASSIDVHKSTALRLLRTLEAHGFVHRQSDHRYRLGGRLFSLAQQALEEVDVRQVAAPYLASLNERYGHTVHLAVLEDGEVVYLDKVESRYPVSPGSWLGSASRIGRRVPANATALGRVLLADLPPEQLAALPTAATAPARAPRRPGSAEARRTEELLGDLAAVKRLGWSMDSGEHQEAVTSIAAPISGSGGRAVAACAISAPADVAPAAELTRLLPELLCTVEAISLAYGGSPTPRWCENRCGAKHAAPASRT
ncbi:IclR family transcriptional regulator [Kitasatospora sp. NBC_00315]|uniref:IclR family transcriptional regulator n=1 Tax=Kitasatospora sp. NBC_00315 TaxID=2975963 RepID=UPI0032480139